MLAQANWEDHEISIDKDGVSLDSELSKGVGLGLRLLGLGGIDDVWMGFCRRSSTLYYS